MAVYLVIINQEEATCLEMEHLIPWRVSLAVVVVAFNIYLVEEGHLFSAVLNPSRSGRLLPAKHFAQAVTVERLRRPQDALRQRHALGSMKQCLANSAVVSPYALGDWNPRAA